MAASSDPAPRPAGGASRLGALAELGAAVASRPWDAGRVRAAARAVEETGGAGLLVEAAAAAGAFEAITKVVDATARKEPSGGMQRAQRVVMTVLKHRVRIACVAGAALVAVTVGAATRTRHS